MAAQRARPHPPAHGRHHRCAGSIPRSPPGRMGCSTGAGPGPSCAGRHRRSGGVDWRCARATDMGTFEGATSGHRAATRTSARRARRDRHRRRPHRRSRGRRRRTRSRRHPLSEQGLGRLRDAQPGAGATRPRRLPRGGTPVLRSSRGCGTRLERRTRPRSPASGSVTPAAPPATNIAPSWNMVPPTQSSTRSEQHQLQRPRRGPAKSGGPVRESTQPTRSSASATTGQ